MAVEDHPPLGYLFWHAPAADVRTDDYEATMARWQQALRAHRPPGLVRGWTWCLPTPPWLADWPGAAYLDVYVVEDFAALGRLNGQAPSGVLQGAHDDAAERAGHGSGALFACRSGSALPRADTTTLRWHDKPAATSYPETLRLLGGPTRSVWLRQMVLGAGPEILVCVDARADGTEPADDAHDPTGVAWETTARVVGGIG